jgi:hypothetical protein
MPHAKIIGHYSITKTNYVKELYNHCPEKLAAAQAVFLYQHPRISYWDGCLPADYAICEF